MVVPISLFSTAAQKADPSHHRYLDRCTHCTPLFYGESVISGLSSQEDQPELTDLYLIVIG